MEPKRADKKKLRWQRIVAEAARQSKRAVLPICDSPITLETALKGCHEELKLMLWEEESLPLADRLPEKTPVNAAILVGPEGGFSQEEADLARASGFLPVSLGPRILRTETAGFAVTAVLEYLYGDFGVGNDAVS
jgi:16S rRNA (uracil1498-N3)-methyltransferase